MSTPSKKRREVRAKIFGPNGEKRGNKIAIGCPRCGHGFVHATGTLDPAEGKCSHSWVWDPYRGPRGGITCTNCDLFVDEGSYGKPLPERDHSAKTRE